MAEARTVFSPKLPELQLDELPAETRLALQELERETVGLDRESETIGNLVAEADKRLKKVAPKIPAWLDDEIEPTQSLAGLNHFAYQVGWSRVSDAEWGLAARVVEVIPNAKGKEKRVVKWRNIADLESPRPKDDDLTAPLRIALHAAPLNVRLAALEKLPKLIRMLTKLARERKEALETSRRALEQKQ